MYPVVNNFKFEAGNLRILSLYLPIKFPFGSITDALKVLSKCLLSRNSKFLHSFSLTIKIGELKYKLFKN